MPTIEELKSNMEDIYHLLKKAQDNFKKCPKVRRTLAYIKVRIQCIDDYWTQFKRYHVELLQITTKEQRTELLVTNYYDTTEEVYLSLKTDYQEVLESLNWTESRNNDSSQSSHSSQGAHSKVEVNLPRIDLPKYSGSYENWQNFEDTFNSLIAHNQALSDVQRLHYLKSCLSGEAAATLKFYQITESNYRPAWECLKERYSHKRLVVNAILKRLFQQKKMTNQSANQLKQFINTTRECLTGLQNLKISTSTWDPIVIYLAVQRVDQETHKEWEDHVSKTFGAELPKMQDMMQFIESRIHTLELTSSASPRNVREQVFYSMSPSPSSNVKSDKLCLFCKENHSLFNCKQFGKLTQSDRSDFVRGKKLCFNCLLPGHLVHFCRQKSTCKICGRRHHSLLHQYLKQETSDNTEKTQQTEVSLHTHVEEKKREEEVQPSHGLQAALSSFFTMIDSPGLLATALVPVRDGLGNVTILRAIVDSGAQVTLISEQAAQMLRSNKIPVKGHVFGSGSSKASVSHVTSFEVLSRYEKEFNLKVVAYVMSGKLTTFFPKKPINSSTWQHIEGLQLADPGFNQPGRVDMLLSSKVYSKILKSGVIQGPPNSPSAQQTRLGWILLGESGEDSQEDCISLHIHSDLDNMLKSMWELESSERRAHTADEKLCEKIFQETHSRTDDGRYIVKLPFKAPQPLSAEGETREIALRRLHQLERRFERQPEMKVEYTKVMTEYIEMNHMEEVPEIEKNRPAVYLPHHAVIKEGKETSRTRIVFDASSTGKNNISLNEELLVGPQIQEDLRSLIMRWRMKKICFVADIQKMYRQILVTKEDADYQRILWRDGGDERVRDYRLLRVTFGTASAPYLAVRTLHQLADDEGVNQPDAARMIKEDFYMDDLMSGHDTVDKAISIAYEVKDILQKGGFSLQKWASNNAEFLQQFQPCERSTNVNLDMKLNGTVKTLGISWNIGQDAFQYHLDQPPVPATITKRVILSEIQRLFDPLGWLAPTLVPAKMIMQKLWVKGVGWDEEVDSDLKEEWLNLRSGFETLNDIKIDRWLWTTKIRMKKTTIHGYCDSSTKAYAAVAFMRVETEDGDIKTGIIAAKTRVAPVKPVSLPRLELCGAVLLSRLLKQIKEATRIPNENIFAWTDSTVVLSWLKGDPGRWNVFVSNRVVEILENTGNSRWHHVASEDNPADKATRGLTSTALVQDQLWWNGPAWLRTKEIPLVRVNIDATDLEKRKCFHTVVDITKEEKKINLKEFDTLIELQRVIVYAKRFLNHKKSKEEEAKAISTYELEEALEIIIRNVQEEEFKDEIMKLKEKKAISKGSKLKTLNPILSQKNILMVGGRLRNAELPEMKKHPIIIGHNNYLLPLLIDDAHKRTLHGGIQLTLTYLRSRYWILKMKSAVKTRIHKCLICARQRATNREQIMGDLPKVRVTPARPFLHSGVDFAGPFHVTMSRHRGAKSYKAYISIFICMVTKAIHLELVGDLTSEAFMNAFKRFVARRGRCAHIWSDNGSNLVAGNKELAQLWSQANLEMPGHLQHLLAEDGTQWHFIPPYSPNFGGLWESGVKSVKYHIRRILNTNLTFEEFSTVLCQIEACLNSRPLCLKDNDDPQDIVGILTPGHFLIGEAPINVPEPDLSDVPLNRLSRWQHCQKLVQHFWHRWKNEYLTRLQERPKWQRRTPEFEIGDVVLVKEDNVPPGKWSMGRIVQKHAGNDDVCRVYSLKCHGKIIQRSVSKLCQLPINSE